MAAKKKGTYADPDQTGEYPVGLVEKILSSVPPDQDIPEHFRIPKPPALPKDMDPVVEILSVVEPLQLLLDDGSVIFLDEDGDY